MQQRGYCNNTNSQLRLRKTYTKTARIRYKQHTIIKHGLNMVDISL